MYCYYKCSVALSEDAVVGLQCVIVVFPDHTHLLFVFDLDRLSELYLFLDLDFFPCYRKRCSLNCWPHRRRYSMYRKRYRKCLCLLKYFSSISRFYKPCSILVRLPLYLHACAGNKISDETERNVA